MTGVFRHGRLRLYLLKLLEEAPRHGYEVIRLLQDRFLGVYSPSPGTIYPRLARLEAEGLVTRDSSDGKKVYRITDKGRQELRNKIEELRILEEELAASARDIAMEIGRDVRDTVRSLREELGRAARSQDGPREAAARGPWQRPGSWPGPSARDFGTAAASWVSQGSWPGTPGPAAPHDAPSAQIPWTDLERLATDFVKDVASAATRARSGLDEAGLRDLRGILADTLGRISTEVFGPACGTADDQARSERQQGAHEPAAAQQSNQEPAGKQPADPPDTPPTA